MQVGDEYFFLEMNTRVQVEHCVTEMVTGIDIVREQVRIAAGEELSIAQEEVELRGHAIECRINAEAAHKNFAPAPGKIDHYIEPAGPGVRVDSGLEAGSEVTPLYDPMVAKLITWDVDREQATARMLRALGEYEIEPLTTLIPFHKAILATEQWAKGETCRDLTEDKKWLKTLAPGAAAPTPAEGEEAEAETVERNYSRRGRRAPARGQGDRRRRARLPPRQGRQAPAQARALRRVRRRRPAVPRCPRRFRERCSRSRSSKGAEVEEGTLICVIEAMKMENEITAHRAGKVTELNVSEGAAVDAGDAICKIE